MARPHNSPDVFRAVAHPIRRKMLDLLRQNPRTAAELAQPFNVTQAAVSEHLRALRVAGLIAYRSRGAQHVYSLVRPRLKPIEEWLRPYQRAT